jgi:N-acetylglucosamine-6-sulfatase
MESLQDVDDMVGRLVGTLRERGMLENTYVVFSSDNGYAMYDNRIYSKGAPYEKSHNVPLIVRGPDVPAGVTDDRLVANIDLAPTFAGWAGARTPPFVDGRSLAPVLSDPGAPWRTRLLFEQRFDGQAYDAIRTSSEEVLIEYPRTEETEYYDLKKDPHQLDGQSGKPPAKLASQLRALKDCAAAGCRRVDGGP